MPGSQPRNGLSNDGCEVGAIGISGYLPMKDAANWAGVSPRTLRRWVGKGLPVYQAGPREKVLIRPSDIERFLTRRQQPRVDLTGMVEEVFRTLGT